MKLMMMMIKSSSFLTTWMVAAAALALAVVTTVTAQDNGTTTSTNMYFNRLSTFYVCSQTEPNCNTEEGVATVAEIVTASTDGMKLLYTDSESQHIGVVDISMDLATMPPIGLGQIAVDGEPTSVVVVNDLYAIAAVNTAVDFVNVSGQAVVIEIASMEIVRTIEIGGQPDSVAVSPDKTFVAIAVENERDEDLNDGLLPQLPAGFLIVMDVSAEDPMEWTSEQVDLTDLDNVLYNTDPEPEYVSINTDNICVVTLQENNAVVLVDLTTLQVTASFSAGSPLIEQVDVVEDGIIDQPSGSVEVPREPDAVAWIGTTGEEYFATANEGDLDGGSRGFSIFDTTGAVVYDSGNDLEWWTVRIGQYPEARSESKGNEPEGILYAEFGETPYLFVLSERSSVIFVYTVEDVAAPVLVQILPAQSGPEGVVAIPERNLLVVASEVDERENNLRSVLNIYELASSTGPPTFPTLISGPLSGEGEEGPFIPFSALSGLSSDAPPTIPDGNPDILYSIEDSFYKANRMFVIDVSSYPAVVTAAVPLSDSAGVLSGALADLPADLAVNASTTTLVDEDTQLVNLDLEGISKSVDGGFWIVSEGSGTMEGDEENPYAFPNMLLKVSDDGDIEEAIFLPEALAMVQVRYGFEGVAEDGAYVVCAMQRAWNGEPNPRLAIYEKESGQWTFVFYPLDEPASQAGGWVGMSDISPLGDGKFLVLERDNQFGPDAVIKRLYEIDLGDFSVAVSQEGGAEIEKQLETGDIVTIEKTLKLDLVPVIEAYTNAKVAEKFEGLAVTATGDVWINNDNDGVDNNSGEQLLLNLGMILSDDAPPATLAPISEPSTDAPGGETATDAPGGETATDAPDGETATEAPATTDGASVALVTISAVLALALTLLVV